MKELKTLQDIIDDIGEDPLNERLTWAAHAIRIIARNLIRLEEVLKSKEIAGLKIDEESGHPVNANGEIEVTFA